MVQHRASQLGPTGSGRRAARTFWRRCRGRLAICVATGRLAICVAARVTGKCALKVRHYNCTIHAVRHYNCNPSRVAVWAGGRPVLEPLCAVCTECNCFSSPSVLALRTRSGSAPLRVRLVQSRQGVCSHRLRRRYARCARDGEGGAALLCSADARLIEVIRDTRTQSELGLRPALGSVVLSEHPLMSQSRVGCVKHKEDPEQLRLGSGRGGKGIRDGTDECRPSKA